MVMGMEAFAISPVFCMAALMTGWSALQRPEAASAGALLLVAMAAQVLSGSTEGPVGGLPTPHLVRAGSAGWPRAWGKQVGV